MQFITEHMLTTNSNVGQFSMGLVLQESCWRITQGQSNIYLPNALLLLVSLTRYSTACELSTDVNHKNTQVTSY